MLRRVRAYIEQQRLLQPNDKVIVGLSGGADSVALLDLLLRLDYKCIAVHCNFHLRGEESERDEQFVRSLCEQRGVRLVVEQLDTKQYAADKRISIEMAARELRYNLFEQVREEYDCAAIAVAHHQNDQAETLLLNLIRGTGIRGLAGMKPRNGYIVRPLLCTTHSDILDYLTLRHLGHVEDSTNSDTDIIRNRLRNILGSFPETAVINMANAADIMGGYNNIVESYINSVKGSLVTCKGDEIHIDIAQLLKTPAPETILYELLREYGFPQTEEIYASLSATSGRYFHSPTHTALKDRQYLIIYPNTSCESNVPEINISIRSKREHETYPSQEEWKIVADGKIAEMPLSLRHYRPGDRFCPIGMQGTRKLQDFFTDLHLTRREKEEVWLLMAGEEIAWVVGYRLSDRYKVTEKSTMVAEIRLE